MFQRSLAILAASCRVRAQQLSLHPGHILHICTVVTVAPRLNLHFLHLNHLPIVAIVVIVAKVLQTSGIIAALASPLLDVIPRRTITRQQPGRRAYSWRARRPLHSVPGTQALATIAPIRLSPVHDLLL
jgi:hypothetical protein|tara:strand:+ start:396 stop:782 length:387 start_codon:yes stop_codon:yes gene_type:complete